MLSILKDSNPILREKSLEVTNYGEAGVLATEMLSTLKLYNHGLALAAPQVGSLLRMFVIKKELAKLAKLSATIFINPSWKLMSMWEAMPESCLSSEGVTKTMRRHPRILFGYTDLAGKTHKTFVTHKLIAQVIQHECDHLDGILLIGEKK
jgi:peptide deformylase